MKRTTKRFLAIFLTSMMLCSFIPAAATAYVPADEDGIAKSEAVEVLVALDVKDGYKDVFVPEGTFTRQQAAKLIFSLKNGNEAVDITSAAMTFFDENEDDEGKSLGDGTKLDDGRWQFFVEEPGSYGGWFYYEGNDTYSKWVEFNVTENGGSAETIMHRVNMLNALGESIYNQRVAPGFELDEAAIRALGISSLEPGDSPLGWLDNNTDQLIRFGAMDLKIMSDQSYTLATASNTSKVESHTDANGNPVTGIVNYNGSKVEYTQNLQTNAIQERVSLASADMALAAGTTSAAGTVAQITASTQASPAAMPAFEQQLNQVIFEANASDLNQIGQANKSLRLVTDAGTWQVDNTALKTLFKAEKQTANGAVTNPDGLVQLIANKTPESGWSIQVQKFVNGKAKAVVNRDVVYNLSFTEAGPKVGTLQTELLRGTIAVDSDVNDQNVATTVLRKDLEIESGNNFGGNAKSIKEQAHSIRLGVGFRF